MYILPGHQITKHSAKFSSPHHLNLLPNITDKTVWPASSESFLS
jgi:hypothetical protein